MRELGYEPIRADKETIPNSISRGIVNRIIRSELMLADISDNNPNVFYELAIRNAIKKPVIIIKKTDQTIPFDIKDIRAISLDMSKNRQWNEAKKQLKEYINGAETNPESASESILSDFEFNIKTNNDIDKNTDIIIRLKDIEDGITNLTNKFNKPEKWRDQRAHSLEESWNREVFGTPNFITIDTRQLLGSKGRILSVAYNIHNVNELLDKIYLEMLYHHVGAYTYLNEWILMDMNSNKLFDNIGDSSPVIKEQFSITGSKYDTRSLIEVGIEPGMNLIIKKP